MNKILTVKRIEDGHLRAKFHGNPEGAVGMAAATAAMLGAIVRHSDGYLKACDNMNRAFDLVKKLILEHYIDSKNLSDEDIEAIRKVIMGEQA